MSLATPTERDAGGAAAAERSAAVEERVWLAATLVALAAVLAFRVGGLLVSQTHLFFDEAQYWDWSRTLGFGYFSKPPLIAWIIRLATEVCGDGIACVRSAAPVLQAMSGVAVFVLGRALFDARIGFFSAVLFITLPLVSNYAAVIATDAPLWLCWALALVALDGLRRTGSLAWGLALGLALGLGLLAKYAMLFFLLSVAFYAVIDAEGRRLVRQPAYWVAMLVAAAVVSPNVVWNVVNGLTTFRHTVDNASLSADLLHPDEGLEFLLGQIGVFGPIMMAAAAAACWRWARGRAQRPERFLIAFTLPILAVMLIEAFLARANDNWAGPAYVAATVLATHEILRWRPVWLVAALLLNAIAATGVIVLHAAPASLSWMEEDPLARITGWAAPADAVRQELYVEPYGTVLTLDRETAAHMAYFLRDLPVRQATWQHGPVARSHFEQVRPFGAGADEPVLLVSRMPVPAAVRDRFTEVQDRGTAQIGRGASSSDTLHLYRLTGFDP